MKKINSTFFCLLVLSYSIFAQEVDTKKLKAQEILAKAKSKISNKIKFESVASLSLNYKTTAKFKDDTQAWDSTETNDLYLISDKIRLDTFGDYGTNISNTSLITNGVLFEKHFEVFVDGKKLNAAFNFTTPKEIQIGNLKKDAWIMTFPIFLNSSLYQNLEFGYVGIAESKDTKAKIIQTTKMKGIIRFLLMRKLIFC